MATGLLSNQIAYAPNRKIRFVFRSDDPSKLTGDSQWKISNAKGDSVLKGNWQPFGKFWAEHWWTAQVELESTGQYSISTIDSSHREWVQCFHVEEQPYLHRTFRPVALDQFERRSMIPPVGGKGWIDCGAYLSEANSHAVAVFGMCEFILHRAGEIVPEDRERLLRQIAHGARYFLFLAEEAKKRGLPPGSFQHEPVGPSVWILQDCLQIGVAICRAVEVLRPQGEKELCNELLECAKKTYTFVTSRDDIVREMIQNLPEVPPDGGVQLRHFAPRTHALEDGTPIPESWSTRELLLLLHFQLLLDPWVDEDLKGPCWATAASILKRWQAPETTSQPFGYFIPFPDVEQAEVAWCHHSVGRDTGGVFPHWLFPLYELCQRYPDHQDSKKYEAIVRNFFGEYMRLAARNSPFSLLPNTWKKDEGWLYFAGLWHGMNASYALMAMQCFYFAQALDLPWLADVGQAQLDWIAGLNCGVTQSSLYGCLMSGHDVPPGEAAPVSLIYGIGNDYAGSWRTIRGSICNGFSRGKQFHFDVPPILEEDRPDALTDEDWITHAGAWLAALAHSDL